MASVAKSILDMGGLKITNTGAASANGEVVIWEQVSAFITAGVIQQGGNTFGAGMLIGTNDGFALSLETGGVVRTVISTVGELSSTVTSSATNSVVDAMVLSHNSSASPVVGIGTGLVFRTETTSTENQFSNRIASTWTTASHATRTSALVITGVNSGTDQTLASFQSGSTPSLRIGGGTTAYTNAGITPTVAFAITSTSGTIGITSTTASAGAVQINALAANGSVTIGNSSFTSNSVSRNVLFISDSFSPAAAGTNTFTGLTFNSIINQTGGHTGITYGIRFTPTLTAAVDWRSISIEHNAAASFGIHQSGANTLNFFNGDTGFGTAAVAGVNVVMAGPVRLALGSDADGDIWYRSGSNLTRLGIGASGTYLTSNGSVPSWAAISGLLPSGTTNQTLRHNGTTWVATSMLRTSTTGVTIGSSSDYVSIDTTDAYSGTGTATLGGPRIRLGLGAFASNDDSAINVGRVISGAALFSHAFRDESDVTITSAGAYTAFDATQIYRGSASYNHGYAFQSRPNFAGSGTMTNMASLVSYPIVSSGTVTDLNHIKITNWTGAGAVTTQYGIDIDPLTGAGANYAIYVRGTTPSYFGGRIQTGGDFISTGDISAANFYTNDSYNSVGLGKGIAAGATAGFYLSVLGHNAGAALVANATLHNTFVGSNSGAAVTNKNRNSFFGSYTGQGDNVEDGVRIGYRAGQGDTRNGMLFIANNDIGNWIVGDASLNVGFGTSSPATKLHVVGTTRISTLAGSGNRIVLTNTNGDLSAISATQGDVLRWDGGNFVAGPPLQRGGQEIVYGTGSNVTSSIQFKYDAANAILDFDSPHTIRFNQPQVGTAFFRFRSADASRYWKMFQADSSDRLVICPENNGLVYLGTELNLKNAVVLLTQSGDPIQVGKIGAGRGCFIDTVADFVVVGRQRNQTSGYFTQVIQTYSGTDNFEWYNPAGNAAMIMFGNAANSLFTMQGNNVGVGGSGSSRFHVRQSSDSLAGGIRLTSTAGYQSGFFMSATGVFSITGVSDSPILSIPITVGSGTVLRGNGSTYVEAKLSPQDLDTTGYTTGRVLHYNGTVWTESGNMFLFSNGNVSIGTATNSNKLFVNGSSRLGGFIIQDAPNSANMYYQMQNNGTPHSLISDPTQWGFGTANDLAHIVYGDNKVFFGSQTNQQTLVLSSGNVGIGTMSPSQALDVVDGGVNTYIRVQGSNIAGVTLEDGSAGQGIVALNSGLLKLSSVNGIAFGESLASARMRIFSGGNVSIGNASDTHKLSVTGTVRSSSFLTDEIGSYTVLRSDRSGVRDFQFDNVSGDLQYYNGANYSFVIKRTSGFVGLGGITTPTAYLHLAAGASGLVPLKFTPTGSTLISTPEAGAVEVDATRIYYSPAAGADNRKTIAYTDDVLNLDVLLYKQDFIKTNVVPSDWLYSGDPATVSANNYLYGLGSFSVITDTFVQTPNGFVNMYHDASYRINTPNRTYTMVFAVDFLSANIPNTANTGDIYIGIGGGNNTSNGIPDDFVGFHINPVTSTGSRRSMVLRKNGTQTSVSASGELVAGYTLLKVVWSNSSVQFWQDNTLLFTQSTMTNAPNAEAGMSLMVKAIRPINSTVYGIGCIVAAVVITNQ